LEGHGGSLGSGHHVAMENQWTCMNMSMNRNILWNWGIS
jgi:hypothetical protein